MVSLRREQYMRSLILATNILTLMIGCTSVNRSTGEAREITTSIPCETPSFVLGDPIFSAELASDIAEYVLAQKGIDCRNQRRKVSFFEGVYTVAFFSGLERPEKKYTVDIDADTSRILSVTAFKKALLAANNGS